MIIHKERRGVEEYFSSKIRENGCCFAGKKVEYRSIKITLGVVSGVMCRTGMSLRVGSDDDGEAF